MKLRARKGGVRTNRELLSANKELQHVLKSKHEDAKKKQSNKLQKSRLL